MEEARELLLSLGARRFGIPEATVVRTVGEIRDESVLRQLALRVLDAQTWGDLLGRWAPRLGCGGWGSGGLATPDP